MIAFGLCSFQSEIEAFGKIATVTGHDDGCLYRIEYAHLSKSCTDLETRRLAKGTALLINLGHR